MKICKKCGLEGEFYGIARVNKDGTKSRDSTCKECRKRSVTQRRQTPEGMAGYKAYQRHRYVTIERAKRIERLQRLDLLKSNPCSDCGHSFPPECMDFDHIDPREKLFPIANAVARPGRSWEEILLEISKCRLICACCHRIRTAKQHRRGL